MIDTVTKIVGIIGNPLKQSLSPVMHNATLQKMGLNYIYLPFTIKPDQLDDLLTAVRVLNIRGLNVTIPFKQLILPRLDDLSDDARACGAVNVVKNVNGRLIGYNTDGRGFIASLNEQKIPIEGRAVFIGAGGAARSVACALATSGISHIDFLDINETRAVEMAESLKEKKWSCNGYSMDDARFAELSRNAEFIVNASPIGMYPGIDASPVPNLDGVSQNCVVCDLIYNPNPTRILMMGQKLGLRTVSGFSMFVHQGALTLEIWTGLKPPLGFMKEVAVDALQR